MLPLPNSGGKIEYFLICSLVGTTEGFHGAGRSKMLFGEQYLPGIGCGLLAGSGQSVCVLEASGHLLPWCLSSRVRRHAAKSPGSVLVLAQRAVRAASWPAMSWRPGCPGGWLGLLPAPLFSLLLSHHHDRAALLHRCGCARSSWHEASQGREEPS